MTRNPFFPLIDELNESVEWRINRRGATQRRTNQRLYDRDRDPIHGTGERYDTAYNESTPDGWTGVQAASTSRVAHGVWGVSLDDGAVACAYDRQEPASASDYSADDYVAMTWVYGGVRWRDQDFGESQAYSLGIYANNGGAVDTANFARFRIQHDPKQPPRDCWSLWGEIATNGAISYSEPLPLPRPVMMPLWLRVTAITEYGTVVAVRLTVSQSGALNTGSPVFGMLCSIPLEQPWRRIEIHRSTGSGAVAVFGMSTIDYHNIWWS
jgi:hypothetical protein